jgi:hypothetical protein
MNCTGGPVSIPGSFIYHYGLDGGSALILVAIVVIVIASLFFVFKAFSHKDTTLQVLAIILLLGSIACLVKVSITCSKLTHQATFDNRVRILQSNSFSFNKSFMKLMV